MVHIAWLVEHVYLVLVPLVIVATTFVFTLRRDLTLAVPFIVALVLIFGLIYLTHVFLIFFISLPTMFVTLWIPVLTAGYLSYGLRWMVRRCGLAR